MSIKIYSTNNTPIWLDNKTGDITKKNVGKILGKAMHDSYRKALHPKELKRRLIEARDSTLTISTAGLPREIHWAVKSDYLRANVDIMIAIMLVVGEPVYTLGYTDINDKIDEFSAMSDDELGEVALRYELEVTSDSINKLFPKEDHYLWQGPFNTESIIKAARKLDFFAIQESAHVVTDFEPLIREMYQ